MLVLCGPQGAGKKDLALKLVDEFPDYFGYGYVQISSIVSSLRNLKCTTLIKVVIKHSISRNQMKNNRLRLL